MWVKRWENYDKMKKYDKIRRKYDKMSKNTHLNLTQRHTKKHKQRERKRCPAQTPHFRFAHFAHKHLPNWICRVVRCRIYHILPRDTARQISAPSTRRKHRYSQRCCVKMTQSVCKSRKIRSQRLVLFWIFYHILFFSFPYSSQITTYFSFIVILSFIIIIFSYNLIFYNILL